MGDSEGKAAAIGGGAYVSSYAAAPSARRWTANSSSVDGWVGGRASGSVTVLASHERSLFCLGLGLIGGSLLVLGLSSLRLVLLLLGAGGGLELLLFYTREKAKEEKQRKEKKEREKRAKKKEKKMERRTRGETAKSTERGGR